MYDLGGELSCRSPTCRVVGCTTLEYLLVIVLMKTLLDIAKTFLLYEYQFRQSRQ